MSDAWWLRELTIEGFRGYVEPKTLDISAPVVLLEGPQRSGKSSTLTAIEWGLFGDEVAKKQIGIDERRGWQVRNRNAGEAHVEIVLRKGSNTLRVLRSDRRRRGAPNFSFALNGTESNEEGELRALLGIEAKDYFSCVHLHQEVIRALLTETPAGRRDMLYRLLGLSDLRNVVDGIKAAKISNVLKDVDQKFGGIEQILNAVVTSKRRDIEEARELGAEKGLAPDEFSEKGARRLFEETETTIADFVEQYGLPMPVLPKAVTTQEKRQFCEEAREALRKIRDERPDLSRQEGLLQRLLRVGRLGQDYEACLGRLGELTSESKRICRAEGSREVLQERISTELEPKLRDARDRANEVNERVSTIQEAMKYFELAKVGALGEVACPVCEKPIADVLHLQNHLEEVLEGLGEDLTPSLEEVGHYEAEISRSRRLIDELCELEREIVAESDRLSDHAESIRAELGREITAQEDVAVLTRQELADVEKELEDLDGVIRDSNQKLNEIEDRILCLEKVQSVLELEADIAKLLKIAESQEHQQVENAKLALEEFGADVDIIRQAVEMVLEESAAVKLGTAKRRIDETFREVANRPGFSGLEIDPGSFEILVVENSDKLPAITILNHGDMNCAALSLFLGLGTASGLSHELGFLILDDPSQSLDAAHAANLVTVLNTLPKDKQLVLSTSEDHLARLMKQHLVRKKILYKFEPWSEAKGATPREADG